MCIRDSYLYEQLLATGKFTSLFDKPFLKEFAVRTSLSPKRLQEKWMENGIFAGIEIEKDVLLFSVTEKRTKEEIDKLVALIKEV